MWNHNHGEIWFCAVSLPNFPALYAATSLDVASLDATPSPSLSPSSTPPSASTPRCCQPRPRPRLRPRCHWQCTCHRPRPRRTITSKVSDVITNHFRHRFHSLLPIRQPLSSIHFIWRVQPSAIVHSLDLIWASARPTRQHQHCTLCRLRLWWPWRGCVVDHDIQSCWCSLILWCLRKFMLYGNISFYHKLIVLHHLMKLWQWRWVALWIKFDKLIYECVFQSWLWMLGAECNACVLLQAYILLFP
jgi:hypothetical protein